MPEDPVAGVLAPPGIAEGIAAIQRPSARTTDHIRLRPPEVVGCPAGFVSRFVADLDALGAHPFVPPLSIAVGRTAAAPLFTAPEDLVVMRNRRKAHLLINRVLLLERHHQPSTRQRTVSSSEAGLVLLPALLGLELSLECRSGSVVLRPQALLVHQ